MNREKRGKKKKAVSFLVPNTSLGEKRGVKREAYSPMHRVSPAERRREDLLKWKEKGVQFPLK